MSNDSTLPLTFSFETVDRLSTINIKPGNISQRLFRLQIKIKLIDMMALLLERLRCVYRQ